MIGSKAVLQTFFATILLFTSSKTFAQGGNVFFPVNYQKAYEYGSRAPEGIPGPNYWQNKAVYDIEAEINPETGKLSGKARITYVNNSPDTLETLVLRNYQDLFKKGAMRDFPVNEMDLHSGIKLTKAEINSMDLLGAQKIAYSGTNIILSLPKKMMPGSDLNLAIEWNFTMPEKTRIRYGRYENNNYFFAYWYPQVAVYDDIEGWDMYNFGGLQEMYNEFADFKVSITIPEDYMVWATGRLKNARDVLSENVFKKWEQAHQSDAVINIYSPAALDLPSAQESKTWIFEANYVPDVAFACAKNYVWDAISYKTGDGENPSVFISAVYPEDSRDFPTVAEISLESIKFFSEELPGWPFPYPSLTVFNGSGGMEFPMMVNDGSPATHAGTVHLTSHEILHTYFPFFMGNNERKFAWMDEGWAVMMPAEIQRRLAPGYKPMEKAIETYEQHAGHDLEVPLMISSLNMSGNTYRQAYRQHAYYRSAVAYHLLYDYLGEETFKNALHYYMKHWHGKHPLPYDFFNCFNTAINEDLGWFWRPWFFEMGYPDVYIAGVEESSGSYNIIIKNDGNLPVPVKISVEDENENILVFETAMDSWKNNDSIIFTSELKPKIIKLGDALIPDANRNNNLWTAE